MTSRRDGLTLAERSALSGVGRERAASARHCWVSGLPGDQGRWPGLLAEWAQRCGGWFGRGVYAVDDGDRVVLVEAWVPAEHLDELLTDELNATPAHLPGDRRPLTYQLAQP
jgi:hypothetical protein